MAEADDMKITEHHGTTVERLDRIECKLDNFIVEHGRTHEAERVLMDRSHGATEDKVRSLQDWRIEVAIYLRQAKWAVALAGGAVVMGIANAFLQIVLATR
ncbi:MAG: hypothetical protein MUE61_08395 [Vicinamibacterales bacterium]|jgi:hypothetical protein|nr:hypothetical protein [Vicinamibacterales bacterium]MCU0477184.1 hypothetical protein [Chloroflexota bacterium]MCU0562331.1 hypothetical protein [Desulfobacterales bacterium]